MALSDSETEIGTTLTSAPDQDKRLELRNLERARQAAGRAAA